MENNDTGDESLDSIPQLTYESLEDEDLSTYDNINHTMEMNDNYNSYAEKRKGNDGHVYSEHNMYNLSDGKIPSSSSSARQNRTDRSALGKNVNQEADDEDFCLEYEEDEDVSEEYVQDGMHSYVEHIAIDKNKNDPLIVHGNDGMIKKIRLCNTKDVNNMQLSQYKSDKTNKPTKVSNILGTERINILNQRSSTPMSREYLALQKSVTESKILTEFVTEAANEKPRKLRAKDLNHSVSSSTTDHSYSSVKKSNQMTPENNHPIDTNHSQGKRPYNKRCAPLKHGDSDVDSSTNLRPRSRSKSVHNSEFNVSRPHKKLKKWPSEERINKRSNMRSENSEFAQKQMEFLQRVIHACDTGRSRSRSRSRSDGRSKSCGRRTPISTSEPGVKSDSGIEGAEEAVVAGPGGGGGEEGGGGDEGEGCGSSGRVVITENIVLVPKQPNSSSSSKERSTKRSKHDNPSENDEQQLLSGSLVETLEQPDDESVNGSNTSILGIVSSGDLTLSDNDSIETFLKSVWQPAPKPGYDSFCWKCHESNVNLCCCKCIRSFHAACVKINKFDNIWLCPECTTVENWLNNPKRSRRNELSLDLLSQLLSFALKRMRYARGHYNIVMPYEETTIYKKYVVNPVTLSTLQTKIETKEFRCAEEFVNETKWMLHNAYFLSSRNNTKTVLAAKSIFKICRQEANEIETCAECYLNANTRTDWFVDVCSQPHLLLWAKLKGFPYWPAKAMGLGQNSLINVRFFGEHDRAFVPLKDCFLYSEQDPNMTTGKRAARELADCIKEVEEHIGKIRSKVGAFKYAPFKTPYDPLDEMKQLSEMMPGVEDFIKKQQGMVIKPSLQFKIYKTADNNLSIVQKASTTPELSSSTHDTDEKKKKSSNESNDFKKSEEHISPAKYEVISKVSSDDSNSSKLSTVILKRKSVNGESKKVVDDDSVELPLPKMAKIEDSPVEEESKKGNTKRKPEGQTSEKSKSKHNKSEPKVPIMTIKTSTVKEQASVITNEANIQPPTETNTKVIGVPKEVLEPIQNETKEAAVVTQKVVENIVKNKQGVTIKKVTKESKLPNSKDGNKSKNPKDSPENPKDEVDKKKEDANAQENQKVNTILKGLIPFVEVKKEVFSDNEEGAEQQQQQDTYSNKEKNPPTSNIIDNNKLLEKTPDTLINNVNSNPAQNSFETNAMPVLLTQVKEEVLTDEEESQMNDNNDCPSHLIKQLNSCNVEKQSGAVYTNDVRVVGDTTIQKLSNKSNQSNYIMPSTCSEMNSTSSNNNSSTKRSVLKGVPYGPLPASAFPKPIPPKSFQQTDANLQPRAKKSFPQHSPPTEKLKSACSNQNTSTQMPVSATNQQLDQKKAVGKNAMATVSVDLATNRASNSGTLIISNIAIPPLTAVSNTVPSSISHNSVARISQASITVSGISSSLTTPSIMTQAKGIITVSSASSTTVRSSPTTVLSSPLISTSISASSIPSTSSSSSSSLITTSSINQMNPLTMTTPPPLAGLSNTSLITTQHANGLNDTNNVATVVSSSSQHSPADTHLLGGLVTPTLASAITDVICRGPPKLAIRPSGPLQSDGHPMFPSQAGPVCKRLVENVHKLTDFFISVVEDTMGEMAQGDDACLQAKITLLTMELERSKQAYEQEIAELKRTSDLMLCEMRKSMENEKTRLAIEIRKQCEMERLRSVEETKRKQWCANCFREANFYCCWNTSYCDYPCQQLHWSRHAHTCAQTRTNINDTITTSGTTQQQERQHTLKQNSSLTLNSSANFNKSTNVSQKKEKGTSKTSSNHMMSSPISTAATTSRSNAEVLKLPTNTYLRPVTSNVNQQTLRCNTTYSIPVQRFNAPLPITTPANSNSPQTYTIVQQGSSWVMNGGPNGSNSGNCTTTNSSIIAAPIASVPQVPGQQRTPGSGMGSIISNKPCKSQIRYH